MSEFGGASEFGPALFGGDPSPYLFVQIDAETTTEARRLIARGAYDGTSLKARDFSVGQGGFDPVDYKAAIPVNPDATNLDDHYFSDPIAYVEQPNGRARSYYCLLESGDANVTLGEIGIWAEVQNSPGDPADGTLILMAIGHFPIICKNSTMQYALRVTHQA